MTSTKHLSTVGILGTATHLPPRWQTAAELAELSGIPESVLVARFGLLGKHLAAPDQHPSDLAIEAGRRVLDDQGVDPDEIDLVIYFGSTWKDFPVWQAAPLISERLGCRRAFALELDYVSCGGPVAMHVAKSMMSSDPTLRRVLLVAGTVESRLLDYGNQRARFMFNFGDGAVAVILGRDHPENTVLESSTRTDGSLSRHVKVPAGGSLQPASVSTVTRRQHYLDVEDLEAMRQRLGEVSLLQFEAVAHEAAARSGIQVADVAFLCPIHMKRSMHEAILDRLGFAREQAIYLDDTGHLSGADPLVGLDRLARSGRLSQGDLVMLLAAGTGYTWGATVIRWGAA